MVTVMKMMCVCVRAYAYLQCMRCRFASGMNTFGCKQAYDAVEDIHPCTCVALTVLCFTPRVVQLKRTALIYAILEKNDAMMTALLEHNANVDIQDLVRQDGPHWGYEGCERMDI